MYDEKKKKSKKNFVDDLRQMNKHLMSVNCEIITDFQISMFVLFTNFDIDTKNETLTIAVNRKFTWLLNEMRNYTTFELTEFIELKSKYTKNLYRILKQWRGSGEYIFHDLEEFRKLMDIPETYTNKKMMQKCIEVAVDEISKLDKSFKDFKCEPVYARKRGKPLDKLIFTWQAEKKQFVNESDTVTDVPKQKPKKKSKANSFNDYPQRHYTSEQFETLENKLLGVEN